ncbi:hypothetical protein BC939DRAFT_530064 [Gamsiella multidivaricata]|uniref:uncharacterized protein n=1 Tax=Gamsiella multidivaricata TaxID=101098 RepID=UPI00221F80C5|nr:uncharacterized protein BC939DRAFT_530064 [Gamsiella multidivaricata]KAI7821368.1 hypothetical protein BC939DRAFT_530064 [Gamsiella multidivaricata]
MVPENGDDEDMKEYGTDSGEYTTRDLEIARNAINTPVADSAPNSVLIHAQGGGHSHMYQPRRSKPAEQTYRITLSVKFTSHAAKGREDPALHGESNDFYRRQMAWSMQEAPYNQSQRRRERQGPKVTPILLIRTAKTGAGNRIGGHSRRGGLKLDEDVIDKYMTLKARDFALIEFINQSRGTSPTVP